MRVAVLADIHGNAPALRAVLAELDRERPDAIVVGGDVLGGPLVAESLALLRARPEPLHWISGNADREALAAFDGESTEDDEAGRAAAWSARALDRAEREDIAGWPITLSLDGVRYCHGSPRRDDELVTRATPLPVFAEILAGVEEPLIVGGHTHQQFLRDLGDGRT
jgi:predicted phosphodiesterase